MTVRQVFYRAFVAGLIDKTHNEYNAIQRFLLQMRNDGEVPWNWVHDGTRWMRRPRTHESLRSMLEICGQTCRRALWDDQEILVELWCESGALAEVLFDVTYEWDVPLMVSPA